jgi:hypothetical protein
MDRKGSDVIPKLQYLREEIRGLAAVCGSSKELLMMRLLKVNF